LQINKYNSDKIFNFILNYSYQCAGCLYHTESKYLDERLPHNVVHPDILKLIGVANILQLYSKSTYQSKIWLKFISIVRIKKGVHN